LQRAFLQKQMKGDFSGAQADYNEVIRQQPAKTRFFRWHLPHRLGRPDTVSNLTAVTAQVDQEWVRLLGGYLDGKVPEANLLARTDEGDPTAVVRRRCAAYYQVAMTQLRQGDQARARERGAHRRTRARPGRARATDASAVVSPGRREPGQYYYVTLTFLLGLPWGRGALTARGISRKPNDAG
jgi:hypothetical protein